MAEKKFGIELRSYDDIFKTSEEREEDKLAKIRDIPISEIDDFPDHPFHVRNDEDMDHLVESIKERGIRCPAGRVPSTFRTSPVRSPRTVR